MYKDSNREKGIKVLTSHPYYVKPRCSVMKTRKLNRSMILCDPPQGTYSILLVIDVHNSLKYIIPLLRYRKDLFSKERDWDFIRSLKRENSDNAEKINSFIREVIKHCYQIIIDYDLTSEKYDHEFFARTLDLKLGYEDQNEVFKKSMMPCSISEYCKDDSVIFKHKILDWRKDKSAWHIVDHCKKQGISGKKLKKMILEGAPVPV